MPPSPGPEARDEYERAWQELQEEITALSRRGRRIVAERSGHNIMIDQPEVVIEAVLDVVSSAVHPAQYVEKEGLPGALS